MNSEIDIGTNLKLVSKRWPKQSAVITESGDEFTYEEINTYAQAVASRFKERGLKKGDRVGIVAPNSVEFILAHFATQKIGGVSVPINYRLSADEIEFIVEDSEASLLIYDEEFQNKVQDSIPSSVVKKVRIGDGMFNKSSGKPINEITYPADGNDTSVLHYTSGSTGNPKGVPHTHITIILGVTQMVQEMAISRYDRALHIAPIFHGVGMNCLFNPHWFVGATNVLQRDFDPGEALSLIEREQITGTLGVPAQFRALLKVPEIDSYNTDSLRYIRVGGSSISEKTIRQAREKFAEEFYNTYGLTETGATSITAYTPDDPDNQMESVGKPSYFWKIKVVRTTESGKPDPEAEIQPPGKGVLLARGPMLTEGYLNRPEATEDAFIDGWFNTEDVVEVTKEGYIYIIDRLDNMIKTGGENVYPQEVEKILHNNPQVVDCGVFGIEDNEWGEAVAAAVVRGTEDIDQYTLEEYFKKSEQIADFKRPQQYFFVDNIPRHSGSGSVQRSKLPDIVN
jgi:fatty-acyl-CoA synthase